MHRCLHIPEIVHLICEHTRPIIRDDVSDPSPKPTTLALALTCKHFYEPAISALWNRLDGLQPLLRCMDSDLCQFHETTRSYILTRPIGTSDVAIVKRYAHRVRHLHMSELELWHSVPPNMYHIFNILYGGQPWFPNLRTLNLVLRIEKPRSSLLPFIECLLPPHLQSMTLSTTSRTQTSSEMVTLQSFLSNLPHRHPNLTSLDFLLLEGPLSIFLDAIYPLNHLVSLNIPPVDCQTVQRLSVLPSLRELSIDGGHIGAFLDDPEDLTEWKKQENRNPSFPSLQHLTLSYLHPPPLYAKFFASLNPGTKLTNLSLWNETPWTTEDLASLIQAIACQVSGESLKFLEICATFTPAGFNDEGSQAAGSNILAPLKKFAQLEDLIFYHELRIVVSDEDLQDLSKAWPKLKRLQLLNRPTPSSGSARQHATLQAVVIAASNCPNLSSLTVFFDASDHSIPDPEGSISSQLQALHCNNCPLSNISRVASFLHTSFPNLQLHPTRKPVSTSNPTDADTSAMELKWEKVNTLLKALKRV